MSIPVGPVVHGLRACSLSRECDFNISEFLSVWMNGAIVRYLSIDTRWCIFRQWQGGRVIGKLCFFVLGYEYFSQQARADHCALDSIETSREIIEAKWNRWLISLSLRLSYSFCYLDMFCCALRSRRVCSIWLRAYYALSSRSGVRELEGAHFRGSCFCTLFIVAWMLALFFDGVDALSLDRGEDPGSWTLGDWLSHLKRMLTGGGFRVAWSYVT